MNAWKKGMKKRLLALFCVITMVLGMLPTQMLTAYAADDDLSVSLTPASGVTVGTTVTAILSGGWDASGKDDTGNFTTATTYEWKLGEDVVSTSETCTPEGVGNLSVTVTQTKTYEEVNGTTPEPVFQKNTAAVTVNQGEPILTVTLNPDSETKYSSDLTLTASVTAACGNIDSVGGLEYTYTWYKDGTLINDAAGDALNVGTNGAGTYKVVVKSVSTNNYDESANAEASVTITKATPTVTVNNPNVQYDAPVEFTVTSNAAGSITIGSGTDAKTEHLTGNSGSYSATVDYGTQNVVTGQSVNWSFESEDENYENTSGTATYTVTSGETEASVSVENNKTSPEYGEGVKLIENYAGFNNGEFTYKVNGEESSILDINDKSQYWNSGTYIISWEFSANDNNYENKSGTIEVEVTRKGIEVAFTATKEYDTTNVLESNEASTITTETVDSLTISLISSLTNDDFVNVNENVSVVLTYESSDAAEAYFSVTDGTNSNYYVAKAIVSVTVTPVVVSGISVKLKDKTYDGDTEIEVDGYTLEGVLEADIDDLTITGLEFDTSSKNAGTYTGTVVDSNSQDITISETSSGSMALSGTASGNYKLADGLTYSDVVTSSVAINPAEVTVKQSDKDFIIYSDEVTETETGATYTPETVSDYYVLEPTNDNKSFPAGETPVVKPVVDLSLDVTANESGYYLGPATLSGDVSNFAVYDKNDDIDYNYTITDVDEFNITIKGLETDNKSYALDEGMNVIKASGGSDALVTFVLGSLAADNETYWYGIDNSAMEFDEEVTLYTWDGENNPSLLAETGTSGAFSLKADNTELQEESNLYVKTSDGVFYGPFSITYLYDGTAPGLDGLSVVKASRSEAESDDYTGTLDYGDSTDTDGVYLQYGIIISEADGESGLKAVSWAAADEPLSGTDPDYSSLEWHPEDFDENTAIFDVTIEGSGYLYIKAEDYAGNISYLYGERALVVETSAPETPELKITDDGLYKNSHTVDIEVTDNEIGDYSGIWKVDWYLFKGDYTSTTDYGEILLSAVNSSVNENTNSVPESYSGLSDVKSLNVTGVVLDKDSGENDLEGQYTLYVVATDFCGNTSGIAKLLYFDNSAPTASVTMSDGSYYTDNEQYYYNANNCGIEVVIYDYPYVNDQDNIVSYTITLSNGDVDTDDVVVTNTVTISGTDDGEIVSEKVTLPTATVQEIKNGTISITVSLEDFAGDSEKYVAGNVTKAFNSNSTSETYPSSGVNLNDLSAPVFILDMTAPELISVTDSTDGSVTGNYIEDDKSIYYNSNFSTYFEISDDNLDLENIVEGHAVLTEPETTDKATIAGAASYTNTSIYYVVTLSIESGVEIDSKSYTYSLYIKDRAGNELSADVSAPDDSTGFAYTVENGTATLLDYRVIDNVAPEATISYSATNNETDCYDGETAYYNVNIGVTYIFSDSNLDLDNIFTGFTKDGDVPDAEDEGYPLAVSDSDRDTSEEDEVAVKIATNLDDCSRTYTIVADTVDYDASTGHDNDGNYKFVAYGTDKAGNALTVNEAKNATATNLYDASTNHGDAESAFSGKTKVMDTIQPRVFIDYTDLEETHYYTEGAYYRSSFSVNYTFTDANILNVSYLETGNTYDGEESDKEIETAAVSGDGTAEITKGYTVTSGDGLWNFTVTGKDYAGNPLYIIEYDVDGNGGTATSDSKEQTTLYTGNNKILDTVAPTLTIEYTDLDKSHYYEESDGEYYAYYNIELTTKYSFFDKSGLDQSKLYVGYQYTPDGTVSSADPVDSITQLNTDVVSTYLYDEQNAYISWTVSADRLENGIYNYKAYGEDKAGNALVITENDYMSDSEIITMHESGTGFGLDDNPYVGQTKVMDTVSPVYTSTFTDVDANNTGAVDENYTAYYNTDISVTFTIEDTNLDNGLITTGTSYLTSGDYSTASPAWVSISGDAVKSEDYSTTYTTEAMTFSSKDGVYRYEVYARDKAGNLLVQSTAESAKTAQYQTVSGGDGDGSWWTLRKVYDTVAPTLEFTMWVGDTTIFASSYTDVTSGQATVEGALAVTVNRPYQSSSTASANISTLDLSPTTFEYVFETTAAAEALSNSNTTTYYADSGSSTTGWEASNGEYNNSGDISFSGQQTVELTTLKVKDRAGNELVITVPSSLSGDSVINKIYLDVTPPSGDSVGAEITLSYDSSVSTVLDNGRGPADNPLYSGTVTVTARVQDPYGNADTQYASSGLYRVYFEVLVNGTAVDASLVNATGNGITVTDGTTGYLEYNTSGSTADFGSEQINETLTYTDEITFTFDPENGIFNNNDIEIRVWAEDNSGNGGSDYDSNSSRNHYNFGIDITAPQIRVTYDNNDAQNEKYFKADRTATIVVTERNFDPDTTIITTEDAAIISGWTYAAGSLDNGDDDTWTATVVYNVDGDYTFDVTTADRVGLKESAVDYADSVAPQEFTIDKTVPVITVVFDNNDVRNGRYYNDTRLATISIDEHNFSAEDVTVTTTAEIAEGSVSVPGTSSWNSVGDLNSATVNFSEDGDYTMTVTYTDLAGNEAQTVIIDLFTVDTTAPTLEIGDVEDYMAYNGDVAPSITYYDINYDSSSASVSITGYNHPTGSNLTGTRTEDAFGGSFVCDNIEAVKENDDVYVLTAYVSDLAGNVTEATITFSVNRFGSNYILSVSTQEVVDGYYTAVSPVVEVTEINVNELTSYQVSTSMNGEVTTLTDGTDYSVTSSNPGWWQYVYTIIADNYEAEGTYSTTLLSVDAATNSNSNRAVKEDGGTTSELTIEFTVDKTAPTVVISGVENDEQYIDTNRTIMVYYDDNISVTNVTFYVNDEVVAEYYNTEDNYVLSASGELSYTATAQNRWQTFTVVATDEVGNVSVESSVRFLLTDNLFVQWFNNTPLFVGSIVGVVLLGGFIFFIIFKRRKDEDEEQAQG